MKRQKGIANVLRRMTICPILVMGVLIAFISTIQVAKATEEAEREKLEKESRLVLTSLDMAFPGDYTTEGKEIKFPIKKGTYRLTENAELLDEFKEETGTDFTIIYGTVRCVTTVKDPDGKRVVGTRISEKVAKEIIQTKEARFYNNIGIKGQKYYALYTPIVNKNGNCVGMIAALTLAEQVKQNKFLSAVSTAVIVFFTTIMTTIWVDYNAKKLKNAFGKLVMALSETAKGEFSGNVDADIINREDEFGQIGRAIIDMQEQLRTLVEVDGLTGLLNRRSGYQRLEKLFEDGKEKEYSVILADIDFFKKFNDTYGHDCGDRVLQMVSGQFKSALKENGFAVRWGGEEFLLVIEGMPYEQALKKIQIIMEDIRSAKLCYKKEELAVTMTFGVVNGKNYRNVDDVVNAADNLMYYGKENGRNRIVTEEKVTEEKSKSY